MDTSSFLSAAGAYMKDALLGGGNAIVGEAAQLGQKAVGAGVDAATGGGFKSLWIDVAVFGAGALLVLIAVYATLHATGVDTAVVKVAGTAAELA